MKPIESAAKRDDTVRPDGGTDRSETSRGSSVPGNGRPSARIDGVVLGQLLQLTDDGAALVAVGADGARRALRCRAAARLEATWVGRQVALMFEGGDPQRPLVIGVVQAAAELGAASTGQPAAAHQPDETLLLSAAKRIVLRCGEASLTLTRAGKVLIRGAYVSSRATGVNRVNGASVQIN